MPKRVDVPGLGIVEFPDSMSDDDIGKALSAQSAPKTSVNPTLRQHPLAALGDKVVGWLPAAGGMAGGLIGAAGGTVAGMGVGGVPGAIGGAALGQAAGEAARQIARFGSGQPTPQTAGQAAGQIGTQGLIGAASELTGQGIGAGMAAAAPKIMQSALKPTLTTLKEYGTTAPKLVKTLLDEGINVTEGGLAKLQNIFTATNKEIHDAVANATGAIDPKSVAARALQTAGRVSKQVNPTADLKAVGDTVEEFLQHPIYKGAPMTPAEAQAMKIGTYQQIGKKYGEVSSASIETQKALARGLKEDIAAEVPKIAELNAKDSSIMAAMDAVGRRVAVAGNRDPVGFAWVAHTPSTFLAALIDRNPAVKSMLARGMYDSAAAASKVSPNVIRAAVQALASGGGDEPVAAPPRE